MVVESINTADTEPINKSEVWTNIYQEKTGWKNKMPVQMLRTTTPDNFIICWGWHFLCDVQ